MLKVFDKGYVNIAKRKYQKDKEQLSTDHL